MIRVHGSIAWLMVAIKYTSTYGSVTILKSPWRVEICDAEGKSLTHTVHIKDGSELLCLCCHFHLSAGHLIIQQACLLSFPCRLDEKNIWLWRIIH